jgi:signal transduction histidine kinase
VTGSDAAIVSRLSARLYAQLWWLLPLLLVALLSQLRDHRPLSEWTLSEGETTACGTTPDWQRLPVPRRSRGSACRLWRLHVVLEPTSIRDQVLVLNGIGRDARVWINGHQLKDFDAGRHVDHTSIPQRLALPAAHLQAGDNELLLQIRSGSSDYDRSYLGRVLVGPSHVLDPPLRRMLLLGQQAAQLSVVFAIAIALTVLPIAWSRPNDNSHRWFALAVLSSLLYVWNMGWPIRPLPHLVWHTVAHGGLAFALWALLRYAITVTGGSKSVRRWVDLLGLIGVAALLLRLLDPLGWLLPIVADTVYRLSLLLQLAFLAVYWWRCRGPSQPLARWMTAGALLNLLIGAVDSLRVYGYYTGGLTPYLQHWGVMYLLIVLLVGQIKHILAALNTAENSRTHLRQALDQRTDELQQEFGLRQQAEQARTLAEERQRIMRDMHDGVGGQLVALIGQLEAGRSDAASLKPQLRRSLDDLRLMIDSLDDACADLSVALGMLRQRLQPGLRGLPMRVRWNTAHLPNLAPCPPDVVLQVLRIVQEAITNAIKHARCECIDIEASWSDGQLQVAIIDDGVGLDPQSPTGRGIPSMHQRARKIGATLDIQSKRSGTRVVLSLAQALSSS